MNKENINTQAIDKEIENILDEGNIFLMSNDEKEEAKQSGFNPFWSTKDMEADKVYKFRVISDNIIVKEIEDKFAGKPTARMILSVEELESGVLYDIVAPKDKNKEGNYTSLTLALRRLYALTDSKMKDILISFTKRTYRHEKYGETAGYNINIIKE